MNNAAAQSLATGFIILMANIALFNDHVTSIAFIQIIGSLVGTLILTHMIMAFK